jgi:hypothetical protein
VPFSLRGLPIILPPRQRNQSRPRFLFVPPGVDAEVPARARLVFVPGFCVAASSTWPTGVLSDISLIAQNGHIQSPLHSERLSQSPHAFPLRHSLPHRWPRIKKRSARCATQYVFHSNGNCFYVSTDIYHRCYRAPDCVPEPHPSNLKS